MGFAQLLESGTPLPNPSQKASIDQILRAGWYLLELINEVLDLALIEFRPGVAVVRAGVAVRGVDRLSDADCTAGAAQKDALHSPALPGNTFVRADRTRAQQVLINLLSNAIKYNRHGGSVYVTCSERAASRMRISVQDTGDGLSADKITELFQPFNRLGQTEQQQRAPALAWW